MVPDEARIKLVALALYTLNLGAVVLCRSDRFAALGGRSFSAAGYRAAKRASFAKVKDGVSTKGATGKLVLHVLEAISEFEKSLIIERTQAGLAAARKRGRIGGRKRVMGTEETKRARALMGRTDLSTNDVAANDESFASKPLPTFEGGTRS